MRGGGGGLADAQSVELAAKYREMAKHLGIKLPDRPKKLSDGDAMVWDILEAIDISAAQLSEIATRLYGQMAKGAAICKDLLRYNRLAVANYEEQRAILRELERDGISGLPATPPWPSLFVGYGNHAAQGGDPFWLIDCSKRVVTLATDAKPDGVKIMLSKPCAVGAERGLEGIIALAIGAYLVGGVIGGLAYGYFRASVEKTKLREQTAQTAMALEHERYLQELKDIRADKCHRAGGDFIECMEMADDVTPEATTTGDLINEIKRERGGGGWTWLWVLAGLGGAALGGVILYKIIQKKRAAKKRRAGSRADTEIISR
jgi:hypothetical protein